MQSARRSDQPRLGKFVDEAAVAFVELWPDLADLEALDRVLDGRPPQCFFYGGSRGIVIGRRGTFKVAAVSPHDVIDLRGRKRERDHFGAVPQQYEMAAPAKALLARPHVGISDHQFAALTGKRAN